MLPSFSFTRHAHQLAQQLLLHNADRPQDAGPQRDSALGAGGAVAAHESRPALEQLTLRLPFGEATAKDGVWKRVADHLWSPPPEPQEPLAPFLAQCFAELAVLNLSRIGSWLAVSTVGCPGGWLADCSESSLLWWQLLQQGRKNGPRLLLKTLRNRPELFKVHEALRPADLLLRHGELEALTESWLQQCGIADATQLRRPQCGGGLRRRSFLFALDQLDRPHREALQALGRLSPLTGLVYLDRLPTLENRAAAAALLRMRSVVDTSPRAAWIALLANSLCGALLCLPPQFPRWQQALRELRQGKPGFANWRRRYAERVINSTRRKVAEPLLRRLRRWQAVATPPTDVHVATLHRLSQLALQQSADELRELWRVGGEGRELRCRTLLFEPGRSPYHTALERLLLGVSQDEVALVFDAGECTQMREAVDELLNLLPEHAGPAVGGSLADSQSGGGAMTQDRVCDFWSDEVPLPLPFAGAPRLKHCVAGDYRALLERLVEPQSAGTPAAGEAPAEESEPNVAGAAAQS